MQRKEKKKKKSVLKAKKAVKSSTATSPLVSTAASEFYGLEGGLGIIRECPYSRRTLVINLVSENSSNPPLSERKLLCREVPVSGQAEGPCSAACPRAEPG